MNFYFIGIYFLYLSFFKEVIVLLDGFEGLIFFYSFFYNVVVFYNFEFIFFGYCYVFFVEEVGCEFKGVYFVFFC